MALTRYCVLRPFRFYAHPLVVNPIGLLWLLFSDLASARVASQSNLSLIVKSKDDENSSLGYHVWPAMIAAAFLVLLGGLFAGLTMAYVFTSQQPTRTGLNPLA